MEENKRQQAQHAIGLCHRGYDAMQVYEPCATLAGAAADATLTMPLAAVPDNYAQLSRH